jgi:putative ATP-dependent endonuclease of OLD family
MILSNLAIINFKSCRQILMQFFAGAPTVLIGKNDCGKSTLLTALGLLLSEKPKALSASDYSNTACSEVDYGTPFAALGIPVLEYNAGDCIIVGRFALDADLFEEDKINSYSDQLLLAKELALDGSVFLARRFSSSAPPETYILCQETTDALYREAWLCNATDLGKKTKALGLQDEDILNDNSKGKLSNFERIRAIHSHQSCSNEWTKYKPQALDRAIFPEFRYLDWRASLEDINNLATDNLKGVIEEHFADAKEHITHLVASLEAKLSGELREAFLEDIQGIVSSIQNIKAKVTPPEVGIRISGIYLEKENSDGDIHLDAQGEGVKRQIWFALIQNAAKQVTAKKSKQNFIWAFDEPETHLYPTAQRHLYDILKLASSSNIQVIVSTHSTLFVDRSLLSHISRVGLTDGYTAHTRCTSVDDIFDSLGLRNSDFLFYDKFLVVEGETEKHFIPALYELYTGCTLREHNIQLVVLKGTGNWLESKTILESVLQDFGKTDEQTLYIFDKDFSSKVGASYVGTNIHYVGTQDLEDSINSDVWAKKVDEALRKRAMEHDPPIEIAPNRELVTSQEIGSIKDSIPAHGSASKHDKFDAKIEKLAKSKLSDLLGEPATFSVLPDKGEESSSALMKHITDISQVDSAIKDVFDLIRPDIGMPENNLQTSAATVTLE